MLRRADQQRPLRHVQLHLKAGEVVLQLRHLMRQRQPWAPR